MKKFKITFKILILTFSVSCQNEKRREKHVGSDIICNNLYVEKFRVSGDGKFGTNFGGKGDLYSKWLTDSTNFRMFLGTFDDVWSLIEIECQGDNVFIKKLAEQKTDTVYKVINEKRYNIGNLKKQNNYK